MSVVAIKFLMGYIKKNDFTAFGWYRIVVGVLVLGGAGAAFAYYNVLSGNLHDGVSAELRNALVETDLANEPFYILLMGTDGSNDREASAEFAGDQFRSDSIILARIDRWTRRRRSSPSTAIPW